MHEYMLDIIRPEHVKYNTLSVLGFEELVCEHIGGTIGYGFDPEVADQIVAVLNQADPNDQPHWHHDMTVNFGQEMFAASLERRELDVVVQYGKVLGYLERDNPASVYLITLLNGQHMMPYNKWDAERKATQRAALRQI